MMTQAILYPVFVQITLTFALLYWLGFARVRSARAGEVKMTDVAVNSAAWPPHVVKISVAFANQLQVPILFYVLVGLTLVTNQVDETMVWLAWVFVVLRLAHAFIYITSNNMLHRLVVFAVGTTVILAMWVYFAVQLQVS